MKQHIESSPMEQIQSEKSTFFTQGLYNSSIFQYSQHSLWRILFVHKTFFQFIVAPALIRAGVELPLPLTPSLSGGSSRAPGAPGEPQPALGCDVVPPAKPRGLCCDHPRSLSSLARLPAASPADGRRGEELCPSAGTRALSQLVLS